MLELLKNFINIKTRLTVKSQDQYTFRQFYVSLEKIKFIVLSFTIVQFIENEVKKSSYKIKLSYDKCE